MPILRHPAIKIGLGLLMLHLLLGAWRDIPLIVFDEIGYLGNARYLAGGVMPNPFTAGFYQPGYSLLLVPGFWLFDSPGAIYRYAIVINGVLITLFYGALYLFCRRILFADRRSALIAALITSLYPAYLVQPNLAWTEVTLITSYGLLIVTFPRLLDTDRVLLGIVFGGLAGVTFLVHPRVLPLIPLSALFLAFLWGLKMLHWRTVLAALTALIALSYFTLQLSDTLLQTAWNRTDFYGTATHGMLSRLLTWEGVIQFVLSLLRQLFYLTLASYGLALVGLWFICGEMGRAWREGARRQFTVLAYLLCTATAFLAVSALSKTSPGRVDQVFFGRYNEIFIGFFVAAGLLACYRSAYYRAKLLITAGVLIAGAFLTHYALVEFELTGNDSEFVGFNVIGIFPFV